MSLKDLRISVILSGLDKLSGPLKSISGNAAKLNGALVETHGEIKRISALQSQIGKFRATEQNYLKITEKLAEAQAKGTKNVARLTTEHDRLGRELQSISSSLTTAGIDVSELARHEDRLANKAYDANKALQDQGNKLAKINDRTAKMSGLKSKGESMIAGGAGAVATGVSIAAPAVSATKEAMDFESAMADVRKVVALSDRNFNALSRQMLDLSTRLPISAAGLAQIVAAGGRAGIARDQLQGFAEDAARLGVAFDMLPEDAGNMLAKWRKGFDISRDGAMQLADQVNALTNKFGGNVQDINGMITRIGSLGRVSGTTGSALASMAQVMSSVGVEEEVGATAIKKFILTLNQGNSATKSQKQVLQSLGLDAVAVSKQMQTNGAATIGDVLHRLSSLQKDQQVGALTNLFGTESVAAIAPLLANLKALDANMALVSNKTAYAGSAQAEFDARMGTTAAQVDLANNKVNALQITMGGGALSGVRDLSNGIGGIADRFRKWAEQHPKLSSALVIFTGVIGGLIAVAGGLAIIAGTLAFALGAVGVTLGAVLLPALGIAAAIAAVIAVGWLLYDNWGKIWGAISKWAGDAWNKITSLFTLKNVMFVLAPIGSMMVSGLIAGFKAAFPNAYATVANFLGGLVTRAKNVLGIHSPSRVFMDIGGFITDGLALGIQRSGSAAMIQAQALADGVASASMTATTKTRALTASVVGASLAVTPAAAVASIAPAILEPRQELTPLQPKLPSVASGDMAQGGAATIHIGQMSFTVHSQPGQSPQDIAEAVAAEFRKQTGQMAARQRSAYRDD